MMMRCKVLAGLLITLAFSSVQAQDADRSAENAESTHFFARHSFVTWNSAAVNQFLGIRNSQLLNQLIARVPQTPFLSPEPTLHTAKALEAGFSLGLNRGLVSSGPSRANFTLTYIGGATGIQSEAVGTSASIVTSASQYYLANGVFADKNNEAGVSRFAFQYDHELYFLRPRRENPLSGLGVVLGVTLSRDKMDLDQMRFGQSTVSYSSSASVSGTYSPSNFQTRSIKSEILTWASMAGLAYRASLTNRIILDARIASQAIGFAEGSTNTKGLIFSAPQPPSGVQTLPINVMESKIRYTMTGSGTLVGGGLTYKLSDSVGIRAHYQDRIMKYQIDSYRVTPDPSTFASNLSLLSAGGTSFIFLMLGDLGPFPVQQTDRTRSGGIEFQYAF